MNVPLIPSAVPGKQLPGPAGRGTEAADATDFSDTLAQRRDHLQGAGRQSRATDGPSRPGAGLPDDEVQRPLTPEETLALLAAGATLPLMDAAPAKGGDGAGAGRHARGNGRIADGGPASAGARLPGAAEGRTDDDAPAALRADPQTGIGRRSDPGAPALATESPAHAATAMTGLRGAEADLHLDGLPTQTPAASLSRSAAAAAGLSGTDTGAGASDPAGQALAAAVSAMTRQESALAAPGTAPESAAIPLTAALAHAAAGGSPTAAASAGPAPFVAAALGDPAWPSDFSRQVLTLIQDGRHGGAHTAELRINPPELGPVRIVLQLNESVAQALFVSPHAPVRHALENALPQLQQQLAQAGVSLGQADVSDQQPGQQAFAQADSQGRRDTGPSFSLDGEPLPQSAAGPADTARPRAGRAPDALVDTFA